MGVLMQTFYWNCPNDLPQGNAWWDFLATKAAGLAAVGFTAVWLPPLNKAAEQTSMGYDPYDYYDLGEFDQKGGIATWFGTKAQLDSLIDTLHQNNMQVYADLVINHNSGGDQEEINPIDGVSRWTIFNPASSQFKRNWKYFHPSPYETRDGMTFWRYARPLPPEPGCVYRFTGIYTLADRDDRHRWVSL